MILTARCSDIQSDKSNRSPRLEETQFPADAFRDKRAGTNFPPGRRALYTMPPVNAAAGAAFAQVSSDLTFLTNESGNSLRDRFGVLLGKDTQYFDCLVGY